MNRWITKKLEMAVRVQEWQRAHPYSDRNQVAVVERFEERLAQAQALFLEEHTQRLAAGAARRHRKAVRRGLEAQLVRSVARIGAFATRGDAQVASRFMAPAQNGSNAAFLARASSLLAAARAHQDALTSHGLTRGQLSTFAAGLARFTEATAQEHASRQQHGETRATLQRAVANLTELLVLLDVFNRTRFEPDAGMLSMWRNLRTVGRVAATRAKRTENGAVVAPVTPVAPKAPTLPIVAPSDPTSGVAAVGETEPPLDGRQNNAA